LYQGQTLEAASTAASISAGERYFDFQKTRALYQGTTLDAAEKPRKRNRRYLHCAPPDFLLTGGVAEILSSLYGERIRGRG
jgi:hypothetical protein